VGTAALLGLVISLPGTIGFIITGWSDTRLPPGSLGYVNLLGFALIAPATVLTAPLGAKIAHSFSAKKLSMLFGAFLLIAAGRLFYGAWDTEPKELQPDVTIDCPQCADWNLPVAPFRIYGNTWYVGTDGLSSILIETDAGLILIDGGLPQSAVLIVANIEKLGFDARDISAILLSHAHFDHAGGIAALQRLSGAEVFASGSAAAALATGTLQENDPQFMNALMPTSFPAVPDVTLVDDVEDVSVGSVDIFSVLTPGHTPGGVTWTWQSCVLDTCHDIVYADSLSAVSAEGFQFSAGTAAIDLRTSGEIIAGLDCDIFLSPHTFFFSMHAKLDRRDQGNPFVNNVACMMYAESSLERLEERLRAESGQLPSFD
jgi:metallo-beta-lactamase class B